MSSDALAVRSWFTWRRRSRWRSIEAQRLTPPKKAKLLVTIAQRIAALVARDGIDGATQEIRNLAVQKQEETSRQQQANADRRASMTPLPDKERTVTHILPARVWLPESVELRSAASMIAYMERADGGHCGGLNDAIGHVIDERYTVDLEVTNQEGDLHPASAGTHYHLKLTYSNLGQRLPNRGLWMDIPEEYLLFMQIR